MSVERSGLGVCSAGCLLICARECVALPVVSRVLSACVPYAYVGIILNVYFYGRECAMGMPLFELVGLKCEELIGVCSVDVFV